MRKINKTEPDFYKEHIEKRKPSKYENLKKDGIKFKMRNYMLSNEQNHQCAYTEINIKSDNSHIDHFIKQEFILQGKFKGLNVFSWNNLLTSCITESFGGKYKDNTYKIEVEDYKSIVNPVIDEAANYFEYSFTGEIIPKNDKAKKTIAIFNLNDKALIERRKSFANLIKNYQNQEDITIDEIIKTIGCFESMIRFLIN